MRQSLYEAIIEPLGERYNNKTKSGLVLNTEISIEDVAYTNRLGIVKSIPVIDTPLENGDTVIVHHNTFRQYWNVRGKLANGRAWADGNNYLASWDTIFAYKRDDEWKSLAHYCFVEPIENTSTGLQYNTDRYEDLRGTIFINNPLLEKQGIRIGDTITFKPASEYKFEIDGKVIYKMSYLDILFKHD